MCSFAAHKLSLIYVLQSKEVIFGMTAAPIGNPSPLKSNRSMQGHPPEPEPETDEAMWCGFRPHAPSTSHSHHNHDCAKWSNFNTQTLKTQVSTFETRDYNPWM